MQTPNWIWSRECSFSSDMQFGHALIDEVLSQLAAFHWPQKAIFAVHMALEEAFANAIEHGNKFDENKKVHFASRLAPDRILIEIEDEGEGFDPCDVPDPTDREHISIPSGRGVLLIRGFMSSVTFNEIGNKVTMEKFLTGQ